MDELQYLLGKVAEESMEIGHIALKAQAFGIQFPNPVTGEVNLHKLQDELNDLDGVVEMLRQCLEKRGIQMRPLHDAKAIQAKIAKVRYFAQFAIADGNLTMSAANESVFQ